MNKIRRFNESIDKSLIIRYLEDLKDIFIDVEDEFDIDLNIMFYEFDPHNEEIYKTTRLDGKSGDFYTTSKYEFGYFSISYLDSDRDRDFYKSSTINNCIKMIDKYFDFKYQVIPNIPKKGRVFSSLNLISIQIVLEEPLN